jgi:hypothetical protein
MVTLIRLEADGKTLAEVIADLDATEKRLREGPRRKDSERGPDLQLHDEHYERVHKTCYKGRRVFRPGEKAPGTNFAITAPTSVASGSIGSSYRLSGSYE